MLKTAFAAFEACEQARVLAPSAQAWVHLWTASVHLGQAQLRQAGCMQGETLRLPADVPQLWLAVGRYAEAQGDWAQALRAYEQAQRLRPQDRLAAIWRAHVLARLGRLSEADALFESVGVHCAWPARVTRMGTAWWETLLNAPSPETLVPASAGEWCVPAPLQVGTAVLVSCDGTYWERYGAGLLESWSGQAQAAADDWTADAQNTPQVWLHVQLLNASATVVADARDRALAVGGVSVCHASVTLPPLPTFGPQTQRMAEHRTWFAAARLQCLPWWLARAKTGVVVTDLDVQWHADPRTVWAQMGSASAGAVRFDPRQRVLWEEWYMTLAAFRADASGRAVASDVARYVTHFLQQEQGLWGLDQAALWSAFARHGGPIGLQTASREVVAALPASLVRWPGGPAHAQAILSTGVASQQSRAPVQPTPARAAEGPRLCYTRNFEDVMLQRVFADVAQGTYVDVGASAPVWDSNTYALYRKGWRGLAIEPLDYGVMWQRERPDDVWVQAAAGQAEGELTLHVYGQAQQISTASPQMQALWAQRQIQPDAQRTVPVHRLSTLWDRHLAVGRDVHVLSVDVEGMERQVLLGLDWTRHRPWLVLMEAVLPGVPEPTHAGWEDVLLAASYVPVYFDGVNRFYLAQERMVLRDRLRLPPNVWDNFVSARQQQLEQQVQVLQAKLLQCQARWTAQDQTRT